jgi:hypothetical protein
MEYYKKIDFKNYDAITSKTLSYLETKTHHMDRSKYIGPYIPIDVRGYLEHVPELPEALAEYGLFVETISVYLMWKPGDVKPHIDYTGNKARINLPILNCEGTYTKFYNNLITKRMKLNTGATYTVNKNPHPNCVDQIEMTQAAIVRVSAGHSVEMIAENYPRITLTISTIPDAGTLLD